MRLLLGRGQLRHIGEVVGKEIRPAALLRGVLHVAVVDAGDQLVRGGTRVEVELQIGVAGKAGIVLDGQARILGEHPFLPRRDVGVAQLVKERDVV
ncbi:hypothetical protein FQZ97_739680 [compost metagenome]